MDKYERLEEFKRKVMGKIAYSGETPKKIEKMIEQIFNGLENKYKDLQCSSLSIIEYIEGNLNYTKNEINKYFDEDRKEKRLEYIQAVIRSIERELDDKKSNISVDRHQQEIEQMDSEDERGTEKIEDIMEYFLKDVQSQQNRILDSRGYSMSKTYDIGQEVREFINDKISKNEVKIYEILKKDSTYLKTWILEQYQEYIEQEQKAKNEKSEDEEKKHGREEFLASLDAGISLEEQNNFVEQSKENQKNEKPDQKSALPDHVID